MIKVGCNWSSELKELIDNNAVNIDYIKAGAYDDFEDTHEIMLATHPILLHGLGYFAHTGMIRIDKVDFERANKLLIKCGSPHYGLHLAIQNKNMTNSMTDTDIYNRMCTNIQLFKSILQVPLLLENIPDTLQDRTVFDHYPYATPEQISKLIYDNDVFFLLDVTHAKLTAQFNGWDIQDYITALPLDRVKELHLNGSGYDKNGDIADTHESMKDEDYALLEWVLSHSNPDVVTLEYVGVDGEGKDEIKSSLTTQLHNINKIVAAK